MRGCQRQALVLCALIAALTSGCDPSDGPATPQIKPFAKGKPVPLVVNLPAFLSLSRLNAIRKAAHFRHHEVTSISKSYPREMHGGGKYDAFELPDHSKLVLASDTDGTVSTVSVENQETNSLGFTLDQWVQLFQKYGLPKLGEPAIKAPLSNQWYAPTNGYKVRMVSDNEDTRAVWQVQIQAKE